MKRAGLLAALVVFAGAATIAVRSWNFAQRQLHPPRLAVPAPPAVPGLVAVTFDDPSGGTLHAWWVPSTNRAAIVLVHGHGANRAQLSPELQLLAAHGYGVLAFDLPGQGESDGTLVTWGDREQESLRAAIAFVQKQPTVDAARIGALGFSMGGSTVVTVAAADPTLKAIAITGTYTTLRDELDHDARKWGPLSQLPMRWSIASSGVDLDRVRPVEVICQVAPRPVLIIDGDHDPSAPLNMEQRLADAACAPKTYWVVPGASHGDYAAVDRPGYEQRLVALFDGALLK